MNQKNGSVGPCGSSPSKNQKQANPRSQPRRASPVPDEPIYIAAERATVLGGEYRAEGNIYIVEHDGRLKAN
jgi:hypothetical protein